jgi:hypothetical protein
VLIRPLPGLPVHYDRHSMSLEHASKPRHMCMSCMLCIKDAHFICSSMISSRRTTLH